jgi:hypothetical protein
MHGAVVAANLPNNDASWIKQRLSFGEVQMGVFRRRKAGIQSPWFFERLQSPENIDAISESG